MKFIRFFSLIILLGMARYVNAQTGSYFIGTITAGPNMELLYRVPYKTLHQDYLAAIGHYFEQFESCFDPGGQRYFRSSGDVIVAMDANSGKVLKTVSNWRHLKGIEYDPASDKIIGSYWTGNHEMVAEVNMETGLVKDIMAIPDAKMFYWGESAFDPCNSVYYKSTTSGIFGLDIKNKTVAHRLDLGSDPIHCMKFDPMSGMLVGVAKGCFIKVDLAAKGIRWGPAIEGYEYLATGISCIDPVASLYFVRGNNGITVIDMVYGNVITTIKSDLKGLECNYISKCPAQIPEKQTAIVYPNPTTGAVTFQVQNTMLDATVRIADITGKVVYEITHYSGVMYLADLTEYAKGVYIISATDAFQTTSVKVVKY